MITKGEAAIPLETTLHAFRNQEKTKQRSTIDLFSKKNWVYLHFYKMVNIRQNYNLMTTTYIYFNLGAGWYGLTFRTKTSLTIPPKKGLHLGLCRAVARPVLARPGPVFQGPVRARRPILARFCACKLARPGPGRKSAARRPSGQNGPSKMI